MKNFEIIKDYYNKNNVQGCPDYYILGWESAAAQAMRFEALVDSLELNEKRILDVGCGTGNLLEYIQTRFDNVKYTGIDILEHMIGIAQKKDLCGNFLCCDLFKCNPFEAKQFDVVFASGIFNLNLGNNKEFLLNAIQIFNCLSNEAISFNLLNECSPDKEEKYFYSSPKDMYELIETNFPDRFNIRIIEGYLKNDYTVICSNKFHE